MMLSMPSVDNSEIFDRSGKRRAEHLNTNAMIIHRSSPGNRLGSQLTFSHVDSTWSWYHRHLGRGRRCEQSQTHAQAIEPVVTRSLSDSHGTGTETSLIIQPINDTIQKHAERKEGETGARAG